MGEKGPNTHVQTQHTFDISKCKINNEKERTYF